MSAGRSRTAPPAEELEALVALVAVYAGYPRASVAMEVVRAELDRLESAALVALGKRGAHVVLPEQLAMTPRKRVEQRPVALVPLALPVSVRQIEGVGRGARGVLHVARPAASAPSS